MWKKSKNIVDVGDDDGNINVEIEKKSRKHKGKRKSESVEDHYDKGNLVIDEGNLVNDGDSQKNDKKKKKKKKKRKRDSSEGNLVNDENENGQNDEQVIDQDCDPNPVKKKKNKKKKTDGQDPDTENTNLTEETTLENDSVKVKGSKVKKKSTESTDAKPVKTKKDKKKKTDGQIPDADINQSMTKEPTTENDSVKVKRSKVKKKSTDAESVKTKKDKKKKTIGQNPDVETNTSLTEEPTIKNDSVKVKGGKVKKKSTMSTENNTDKPNPKTKNKPKKVSFSGHVEVFPTPETGPETDPDKHTTKGDGLVRGKRFTPEEDEIVKEAVLNYITAKDLGDEGLKMVLNCNSHAGMKKCWQEIGTCIPYRPYTAVYYRAHILFERAEARKWTEEEIETLKEFHKKYGNSWKKLAEEMGKHRFHVKDTWRRIKLDNLKNGKWTQEEYQNLYDLVNLDLQMKVNGQEKKSKHGMLRDNIPWTAISEKLETRSDATCCTKWYNQLTSSLVVEKKWSDADDYRLIGALYELDATCQEDVEWNQLLEHRDGEVCLKRWSQMVKHIGHQGSQPFAEQVDTLAKRYCPDLAETREIWDNKPVVP